MQVLQIIFFVVMTALCLGSVVICDAARKNPTLKPSLREKCSRFQSLGLILSACCFLESIALINEAIR